MANTTIGSDGVFTVAAVAAAAANDVAFVNQTQAGITGTVTITRTGLTPSPTFPLALAPGEVKIIRNTTAATSYAYAGSVAHTAVNQGVVAELDTSDAEIITATGQATPTGAALVIVSVLA